MRIPVMLKDGTNVQVFPEFLEQMLKADEVFFFRRATGWVIVGKDPIREGEQDIYHGVERRRNWITNLD